MIEKVYIETNPLSGRVSVCVLMPESLTDAEAKLVQIAGDPETTDLQGAIAALADVVVESLHPPELRQPRAE